jgi:hypothetical protein
MLFAFFIGSLKIARASLLNPLSSASLGSFDVGIGNAVTIDTTAGEIRVNGILAFKATIDNQQGSATPASGIPELAVFSFDDINIGPGVAVTITGNRGLALLSRDDVVIRSALSVNGGNYGAPSVAGGFAGGTSAGAGAGPGGGQPTHIGNYAGAGGGAYGGNGGQGGGYNAVDSLGGMSYPVSNWLVGSLYGGSGGGSGRNGDTYGDGGGGGGVLEISALGEVKILAPVTAEGGAAGIAANGYGGGGGGSGGSLRIAGQKVTQALSGVISANGSDGGYAFGGGGTNAGGGGGGGRILIQQNAGPLATGVSAQGGLAIGSAQPGNNGTVEQLQTYVSTSVPSLNVRIGTGSTSGFTSLARGGDSSGALYGLFDHVGTGFTGVTEGTTFAFDSGFNGSSTQRIPLTYTTNSRTTETVSVHSNGGDVVLATGRGVGPTFATNMGTHPDTTINLGSTGVNYSAAFHLVLNNASADLGTDSSLTSLGILSVTLDGPDATAFSVDNLIPTTLFEQQYANLPIHFYPTQVRTYNATLTIQTDQGAANGTLGQTFMYRLTGGGIAITSVPEPFTALILLTLATWSLATRWGR